MILKEQLENTKNNNFFPQEYIFAFWIWKKKAIQYDNYFWVIVQGSDFNSLALNLSEPFLQAEVDLDTKSIACILVNKENSVAGSSASSSFLRFPG